MKRFLVYPKESMMRTTLRTALFLSLAFHSAFAWGDARTISLTVNHIVYDKLTQRIYASVPSRAGAEGDSIAVIDPVKGIIEKTVSIGSEPDKLVLSDDDLNLYVGLDGSKSVSRLKIETLTADLTFPLQASDGTPMTAGDMAVPPGQPNSVAIALMKDPGQPSSLAGIAIYDAGVPRPKRVSAYDAFDVGCIAFGNDATQLYGYDDEDSGSSFFRMKADASGITLQDKIDNSVVDRSPGGIGDSIKFEDGLIYGSSGRLYDPIARQTIASLSVTPYKVMIWDLYHDRPQVEPDSTVNRIFYLPTNGTDSELLGFDLLDLAPVGTILLPKIAGGAELIRWGADGLAFSNSNGIILVRTSMIPSATARADLSVDQTVSVDPATVGKPITYVVTVANNGPDAAARVTLADQLPAQASSPLKVIPSSGSCSEANGRVTCQLGDLPVEKKVSVEITMQPVSAGSMANTVQASSGLLDPDVSNNLSQHSEDSLLNLGINGVGRIDLRTNDLAYDALRNLLYVTVSAYSSLYPNSVVILDPSIGKIEASIPIGDEPGELAISDDDRYLYVALDGDGTARRIDLETRTPGSPFALAPSASFGNPNPMVTSMEAAPGHSLTVGIARYDGVLAIYDDGVQRPATGSNSPTFQYGSSDQRIYALDTISSKADFSRFNADASGLHLRDNTANFAFIAPNGSGMRFREGVLYFSDGKAVDPETMAILGTFDLQISQTGRVCQVVEPDPGSGHVFFVVSDNASSGGMIRIFDMATFLPVKTIDLPELDETVGGLVSWGRDGLALRGSTQLYLLRSSMRLPAGSGDVNGDGVVDIRDVTIALRAVIGSIQLTAEQQAKADLDGNGLLGIADVTGILSLAIDL